MTKTCKKHLLDCLNPHSCSFSNGEDKTGGESKHEFQQTHSALEIRSLVDLGYEQALLRISTHNPLGIFSPSLYEIRTSISTGIPQLSLGSGKRIHPIPLLPNLRLLQVLPHLPILLQTSHSSSSASSSSSTSTSSSASDSSSPLASTSPSACSSSFICPSNGSMRNSFQVLSPLLSSRSSNSSWEIHSSLSPFSYLLDSGRPNIPQHSNQHATIQADQSPQH